MTKSGIWNADTDTDRILRDINEDRATMADVEHYLSELEKAEIRAGARAAHARAESQAANSKLRGMSRIGYVLGRRG